MSLNLKKFFGTKQNNLIILDDEETKHLAVLRCEIGEEILCFCGDEKEYLCQIESISKKQTACKIITESICAKNPNKKITLFQGLPKLDKLELITQKITELGASELVPFESNFTIAKTNLNKISQEACKQCGRSIPVKIHNPIKFKQMLDMLKDFDIVLFANETNKTISQNDLSKYTSIAIIVGSEGGFSQAEIEEIVKRSTNFGLGERILRTETASIVLCGIVSYLTNN